MKLKGVHFLLTYRCDLECDHCFVWSSPKARGVFTIKQIKNILAEAKKLGTVDSVSLEGGEPFLFYPIMIRAMEEAAKLGFRVGFFRTVIGLVARKTLWNGSFQWLKLKMLN